ncbi:hypothetical protein JOF29_004435 [Kribbella aluminosa]|uniref:Helicase ATP-binding domain-containing protein n=1 Tax=Kribbella aluminosa TaxID=416017 RepID=A0ABS4UNV6_9ACTN|nr:hypothetical protein [Kribbella aluminosa]MBP2353325.1 hypothetical protein [Kribbella aluminosa]
MSAARGGRRGPREADYKVAIHVVRGALALAVLYFPIEQQGRRCIRVADALFFLSGQVDKWARWLRLSEEERTLIARLLRWRPVAMANRNGFRDLVEQLVPEQIAEFSFLDSDVLLVDMASPQVVVEECVRFLWLEQEMQTRRPQKVAGPGEFVTWTSGPRGTGAVETRYALSLTPAAEPEEPTDLGQPVDASELSIPFDDLRRMADLLDAAFGQTHRRESIDRIFTRLQGDPENLEQGQWVLRAGATQLLNAPTGVGKNVLAELVACWCAERGMVTTLLVPKNAVVVQTAHSIDASLRALGVDGDVVPLMSPRRLATEAEIAAKGSKPGGLGEWAYDRMHYACALPAAAETEDGVDAWVPGAEPCGDLRAVKDDGSASQKRSRCPWRNSCGKFRVARQAATARVIVTSHSNFAVGRLHVPVVMDGRVEENPSVEAVVLFRSHAVLIDEIDAFQASLIGESASGLTLAKRRGSSGSLLRRFDTEFGDAIGLINPLIEGRVQALLSQARYLAENYNRHLAAGDFIRSRAGRSPGHPMFGRWVLPRRWDGWLAAALFGIPPDAKDLSVSTEQLATLDALFPESTSGAVIPDWLEPVATVLATLTSPASGGDLFMVGRELLAGMLKDHPYPVSRLDSDETRVLVADRLIRRAHLETLRKCLMSMVYAAPQLHASGVKAATEIADALGQFATWRAVPYGPMGRVLFAFTELHDDDRPWDTSLRVSGFGGDPHTYVVTLGDLTARAHTGRSRIVVGLSATGYFPGAPHHHVHVQPMWWVPDDVTGGLTIHATPVSDEELEFLRVSGTSGKERRATMTKLGKQLWIQHLDKKIQQLLANPETARRARLLLATTAYEGAEDLAVGLSAAGVPAERIVLGVRPDDAPEGPRLTARWTEVPADRLEEFGRTVGTEPGSVLIAPLARTERGLNIVDRDGRSQIGSVWLVIRPIPVMDEPAELLAHVNADIHAISTATDAPAEVLENMRIEAARAFDRIFRSLPYFRALPTAVQIAIAKEILNGLIQLAGRARRGGDNAEIHLVDYAFHDTSGKSDLASLIRQIRDNWHNEGQLDLMQSLYGDTLQAIFTFADQRQEDDEHRDH